MSSYKPPSSILIIGSGVFGLSTAWAFSKSPLYTSTKITLLDRSPFPSPDGSSIDTSRIVRTDYSDPLYASLVASAQEIWRQQGPNELGGQGRYTESGLAFVGIKDSSSAEDYVRKSFKNVVEITSKAGDHDAIVELSSREDIERVARTGGATGDFGYLNKRSGWADAEASMVWLKKQVESSGRVSFITAEVKSLLFSPEDPKSVIGVTTSSGEELLAELTILATGAWTSSLVDLQTQCTSTGQVLAYLDITAEEQERLGKMPVILSRSTGYFIIPPANRLLKVARHTYGFLNPTSIPLPPSGTTPSPSSSATTTVSTPLTSWNDPNHSKHSIPPIARDGLRAALAEMIPSLATRPFIKERLCWYTDTPSEDFLVDWYPGLQGLFMATGGSGHGFKFLPVLGEKIVEVLEGRGGEWEGKWAWKSKEGEGDAEVRDGERGGEKGMYL